MFPDGLDSDSLDTRPLTPEHVDVRALYDCFRASREGSADVFRYVPQEPFDTPKDAHDWLTETADAWHAGESAKWAVSEAGADDVAGVAALSPAWDHRRADLAVILARPYWGNGYAGECARALTAVAFEDLDLEVVTLGYDEGNERSRAAIEGFVDELGGQYDGHLRNATVRGEEVVDAYNYSIARAEYREATDSN